MLVAVEVGTTVAVETLRAGIKFVPDDRFWWICSWMMFCRFCATVGERESFY